MKVEQRRVPWARPLTLYTISRLGRLGGSIWGAQAQDFLSEVISPWVWFFPVICSPQLKTVAPHFLGYWFQPTNMTMGKNSNGGVNIYNRQILISI